MTNQKKESPHCGNGGLSKKHVPIDNSATNQRQRLLEEMKRIRGGITTLYVRTKMGIMHPGGRILELRNAGYNILTHWMVEEDDAGNPHRVARYVLLASPKITT